MNTSSGNIRTRGFNDRQMQRVQALVDSGNIDRARTLARTIRQRNRANNSESDQTSDFGVNPNTGLIDTEVVMNNAPALPTYAGYAEDVGAARDSAYNYFSQNFNTDKAREIEDARQLLAQRGIPIDENPGSLWSKTMEGIDRKYQNLEDQARNQAFAAGTSLYTDMSGQDINSYNAFMNSVLGIGNIGLGRYGINKDTSTKLKQIAAQNRNSGSGSIQDLSPIIGGTAPGFNV